MQSKNILLILKAVAFLIKKNNIKLTFLDSNILAKKVASNLRLPIIGIGAGSDVDGQVLVSHDMLGMNKDFSPRFLRRYLDLDSLVSEAVKKYSSDIKSGSFPNKEEQY